MGAKNFLFLLLILLVFSISINFVSAWEFNGTVKDINGTGLYNSTINITIRDSSFGIVGYNSTYSNESGWFNLTVANNSTWMYQPVITHFIDNKTDRTTALDYVGQSLPAFPYQEFQNGININFYLRNAGTINITAVNGSGSAKTFQYQIKDTKLGYPIAESWSYVSSAVVYVPRNRNYSIMIYPNESLPVSFNWNNFSSDSDYSFNYNSKYNTTTHTLNKQFNCSETLEWINGYINVTGIDGWDEFSIVPYILEPGNMIYFGDNAGMPYNMSAWRGDGSGDSYNLSSGFYNITLPAPAESADYMLFATARNGTGYYGQYLNVSLSYGDSLSETNFTFMSGLLNSAGWASSNGNITMNDANDWNSVNISSTRQGFNLVNSTNNTLSKLSAHIEVIVDYSNYGSKEFTFMLDTSQQGDASFYIPMINNTGFKEMNVFSQSYAPKRVGAMTATQIIANPNTTLSSFNPGDIDEHDISDNVYISLYKSNSSCDVPNPPVSCQIGSSGKMKSGESDSFNPLSAIIGGGKLSFRMGLTSTGIEIHYVNVDMLASGHPSALFDDDATESTSSGFDSALRFGSSGPTIYDYVLISMPYTAGSTSQTGLNENADVNMSIPLLYDDNWNVIWNVTANGTSGNALAGNDTHYSTHSSNWETLMQSKNCTTSVSEFNATNPCYIDKTKNKIWVRLPHFSGTKPSITGSVITATTASSSPSTTSESSAVNLPIWTMTYLVNDAQFKEGYTKPVAKNEKIKVMINNEEHNIGVIDLTTTSATISVFSTPQDVTLNVGDEKKFEVNDDNYYDLSIKLNNIVNNKANLTIQSIYEEILEEVKDEGIIDKAKETIEEFREGKISVTVWIIIGIILVLVLVGIGYKYKK